MSNTKDTSMSDLTPTQEDQEILDLIADAIDESMGPDWSVRLAAKYVADALRTTGNLSQPSTPDIRQSVQAAAEGGDARELLDRECALEPGEIDLLDNPPALVTEAAALRAIEAALSRPPAGEVEREALLEQAAQIAEAIDSGRGNEREIARAIRNLKSLTPKEA